MAESELLVNISLRLPTLDREATSKHLGPLIEAAIAVGGMSTNISIQPYDPDDESSGD
jgi:hypothetical protein